MSRNVTPEHVVEAAESLDQAEFSRAEVAERLGVEKVHLRKSFRVARKTGRIEKVRDDDEGTGLFRLTGA